MPRGRPRVPPTQRLEGKYVVSPTGCWLWTATLNNVGYGQLAAGGKRGGMVLAHRVSFERKYGRPPRGYLLHSCDAPACINPAHLREGTQRENIRESVAKGRHVTRAKLTAEQVQEIRERRARGELLRTLAAHFGVSESTVSEAANNQTWRENNVPTCD